MPLIELTKGQTTLVDEEDFELLMKFKWTATFGSRNRKWYAVRRIWLSEKAELGGLQKISMHRFLMRPPAGMVVDHVNGDSLDNRRSNLEIVTQEENMRRVANWRRKAQEVYL